MTFNRIIPGQQLVRQWCREPFDVDCLHFVPDSLYLDNDAAIMRTAADPIQSQGAIEKP